METSSARLGDDVVVVVVGGSSSVGKTTLVRRLADTLGAEHVQVDDLRRGVDDPHVHQLGCLNDPWSRTPEELCGVLCRAATALISPLAERIEAALRDGRRIILEGEGVSPLLAARYAHDRRVAALFVVETDAGVLHRTLRERSPSFRELPLSEQQTVAEMDAAYGRWIAEESARLGLAAIPATPWETLHRRAVGAISTTRNVPVAAGLTGRLTW